jgi:hypothetical protein
LRGDHPQRLPKLRRRLCAAPDPAGEGMAAGLSLAKRPASTKRVELSYSFDEIAAFSKKLRGTPPEKR